MNSFLSWKNLLAVLFLCVIAIGLVIAIWLSQQKQVIKSNATGTYSEQYGVISGGTAEFSLYALNTKISAGEEIPVQIRIKTDTNSANLFVAKISFNKDLLEVSNISEDAPFIKNWIEKYYDNASGLISVVGGLPTPGYKTSGVNELFATITFKAKQSGTAILYFNNGSAVFRNSDNKNILGKVSDMDIDIGGSLNSPLKSAVSTQTNYQNSTVSQLSSSPNKSQTSQSCTITSVSWNQVAGPVVSGIPVEMTALSQGDCQGKVGEFNVWKDGGLFSSTKVTSYPLTAYFFGNQAHSEWTAQYISSGLFNILGLPSYYFTVSLGTDSPSVRSSTPDLEVVQK